jgi:hypothetical protein
MYALLGLPAAGLLVCGRVGVQWCLLKLAGEVSQKACVDAVWLCAYVYWGRSGTVGQGKTGRWVKPCQ